jgi:hypothetical protein
MTWLAAALQLLLPQQIADLEYTYFNAEYSQAGSVLKVRGGDKTAQRLKREAKAVV